MATREPECYCGKCDECRRVSYWIDKADEGQIEEARIGDV